MINNIIERLKKTPRKKLIYRIIVVFILILMLTIEFTRFLAWPKVEAKNLFMRNNPNDESHIITAIPHGKRVKVIKQNHNWWYIKYNNEHGWIPGWLVSVNGYNSKGANQLAQKTIVIDPGHGGGDSGTLSMDQKDMEKTYTLLTAKKVAAQLKQKHVNVIITRTSDHYVTLKKRTQIAQSAHADLFISFHFNSDNGMGQASGYGVYKYYSDADKVADTINDGLNNLPVSSRGVSIGNYYVLRDNNRPAILCEMGFMDSSHDLKYIKSSSYQQSVAKDIAKSLAKYFNN
ncbi:N-acetylmuramoyl-L-alanine amidase [Apilactobacillus apinorum]|uniref:N-acetylmuramoyl-L-alanine amidase n=1 Tax=Apilactobacillus apinorum TaxID=1218495 RepID=UPI0030E7E6F2